MNLLDRSLRKKKQKPSNKLELLGLLRETWQEISQDDIRKLISSMPRRVFALQNAKRCQLSISFHFVIRKMYKFSVDFS